MTQQFMGVWFFYHSKNIKVGLIQTEDAHVSFLCFFGIFFPKKFY